MTFPFRRAGYQVRLAATVADRVACFGMRRKVYRAGQSCDQDVFDDIARHLMVEFEGELIGCCRLLSFRNGGDVGHSYAGAHYDLSPLARISNPMLELGRLCVPGGVHQANALRLVWGALVREVDFSGVGVIFGCTSFAGADISRHGGALAYLAAHHLGPPNIRPRVKSPFAVPLPACAPSAKKLPSTMRSYLALGGWVSDHVVVDDDLDTLHIFTALDVDSVPPARARVLRAAAG